MALEKRAWRWNWLTGWNPLIKFRRMAGLYAFFYGCLHLSTYVIVDRFAGKRARHIGGVFQEGFRVFHRVIRVPAP